MREAAAGEGEVDPSVLGYDADIRRFTFTLVGTLRRLGTQRGKQELAVWMPGAFEELDRLGGLHHLSREEH